MASPGNQHCASCIGTLSFPTASAQRDLLLCVVELEARVCKCGGQIRSLLTESQNSQLLKVQCVKYYTL